MDIVVRVEQASRLLTEMFEPELNRRLACLQKCFVKGQTDRQDAYPTRSDGARTKWTS